MALQNRGSNNIEGIMLDPPEEEEAEWSGIAFEKMNNLQILIVRNTHCTRKPNYLPNSLRLLEWKEYPSKSLPSNFYPTDIVNLSLSSSHLSLEKKKSFPKLLHLTRINFSYCRFITYFPDVSGVPNLGELNLEGCENLITIHHSVGFLKKLKHLSAEYCFKLKDFPPRIWLPSLQYLNLDGTGIAFFPHTERRMYKPLTISLSSNRIKELPNSIRNLVGLKRLHIMSGSLTLGGLPSDLFLLPKIEKLQLLLRPPKVGESFRSLGNSHAIATTGRSTLNKPRYSPLTNLHLSNCGLTDEDLLLILCCFPSLEVLGVPLNRLVSVPTSIKESAKLREFVVSSCIMLEEIPELPESIQKVDAIDCLSMSSEASRMLWSQALNEVYRLRVNMPVITEIPSWFDHECKGGVLPFWARRKFPVVVVAFMFNKDAPLLHASLHINGHNVLHFRNDDLTFVVEVKRYHVLLFDLRRLFDVEEWQILDTFLVSEWNYVDVECGGYDSVIQMASYCAAYVYKEETNMEDIRFSCPNPLKRTLSVVDDPLKKRVRKRKSKGKNCLKKMKLLRCFWPIKVVTS